MSDTKTRRRQSNADSGAVRKLKDRQSAMSKALQNMEHSGDTDTLAQASPTPISVLQSDYAKHSPIYPSKGHRWIDPEVCRLWRLADRSDTEAPHIDDLAQSFGREGQVAPAIVRPVRDPAQPEIRYEVIAGSVRWRAALKAQCQLLADIRPDLDDHTAFRIMVVENDIRHDLSEYTKAKRYQRVLTEGLYTSKGELAKAMGLSNAQLSKYLGFANLPDEVVAACQDISALPLASGYILATLCNRGFQSAVVELLPSIEAGEISVRQLEELMASPEQLFNYTSAHRQDKKVEVSGEHSASRRTIITSRLYQSSSGQPLFSVVISQRRAVVSLIGQSKRLLEDEQFLNKLQALIEEAGRRQLQD